MTFSPQELELGQKRFELAQAIRDLRQLERQLMGCTWERLASLKQATSQQQTRIKRLERAIARLEKQITQTTEGTE